MPENVQHEISETGIARITLNRADRRNALTRAMIEQLTACVREIAANAQVRLIIIAGEGPVFCAGMDLAEMQQRSAQTASQSEWEKDSLVYRDLLQSLLDAPQVTMAAVHGPILAGGVGLALACDFILASESAFFSLPESERGITAAMVTPLLVYRVGMSAASHLLLSGRRVSALDAQRQGLCQQVVAAEKFSDEIADWSQSILRGSPLALAATKAHLREVAGKALSAQLQQSARLSAEARGTSDAREGLQAFLEKRKPAWQQSTESSDT